MSWGTAGTEQWYVAQGEININGRVTVNGDVHLILTDGASLTITDGIRVSDGNSLTIYAQSAGGGMGKLTATATSQGCAGIGGNNRESNGVLTINGGDITARGADYSGDNGGGAGIGSGYKAYASGTITINGGDIKAYGGTGNYGAGAGIGAGGSSSDAKEIIISGGTIYAQAGTNGAAGIGGGGHDGELESITITGGNITAKGTYRNGSTGNGQANAIGGGGGRSPADPSNFSSCVITDYESRETSLYGDPDNDGKTVFAEDYTIQSDETLVISKGTTLVINSGVTLTNNGTFIHDGALENNGEIIGDGETVHVIYSGNPADETYHEGACGCGETVRETHTFGNYRDKGDGTHAEYCSLCDYEKEPVAHSYVTSVENGTFKQVCSHCGDERTITVGDVGAALSYDMTGETIGIDANLSVQTSEEVEGISYQWQRSETLTVDSVEPSTEESSYYARYT